MATLKISDLSVGDWVAYNGKKYRIKEISSPYASVTLWGNNEQRDESIVLIKPIFLSTEILEKNGFERVEEDADTALYGTPSCSIFHTKGTLRYTLDTHGVSATCFFIHQLQHLEARWGR